MTTEKKYYKRDPQSPFYELMADTSVEDSKTVEEKDYIYWTAGTNLCFCELETNETPPFERDYMMYCALNEVPKEIGLKNILSQYFTQEEIDNLKLSKD